MNAPRALGARTDERPDERPDGAEKSHARAEVAISNEARERAALRAQNAEAQRERADPSVLAVRFGPAPVRPLSEFVEQQIENSTRSLPTVAPVLSTPAPDPDRALAPASPPNTTSPGLTRHDAELERGHDLVAPPGSGRARRPEGDARPLPLPGAGRAAAREDAPPPPEIGFTQARERAEQSQRDEPVSREAVERAATFATAAAAPQGLPNERDRESRPELLGAPDQPIGSAIAQRALTQAGVVEAERADAPIARYLLQNPEQDLGPEPRPAEILGVRSQPLSYYA